MPADQHHLRDYFATSPHATQSGESHQAKRQRKTPHSANWAGSRVVRSIARRSYHTMPEIYHKGLCRKTPFFVTGQLLHSLLGSLLFLIPTRDGTIRLFEVCLDR